MPGATVANAGSDNEICNSTTYTLQGNTPVSGTGVWTAVGNPPGITFSPSASSPTATAQGLQPGTTYQFKWTITANGTCPPTSSTVTITDDKSPVGGTTAADATVCSGTNAGTICTGRTTRFSTEMGIK